MQFEVCPVLSYLLGSPACLWWDNLAAMACCNSVCRTMHLLLLVNKTQISLNITKMIFCYQGDSLVLSLGYLSYTG